MTRGCGMSEEEQEESEASEEEPIENSDE